MQPAATPTNCDREPVPLPGSIQPHGMLVAADAATLAVVHVSANVVTMFDRPVEALVGAPLAELFGRRQCDELVRGAAAQRDEPLRPWRCDLLVPGGGKVALEGLAHVHAGLLVIELFLPTRRRLQGDAVRRLRQQAIAALRKPDTIAELCEVVAATFRLVSGYDRVMVYRFAADACSEVVAESCEDGLRYRGLHFSASDVPAQVRRLHALNLIRVIGDVDKPAVPLHRAPAAAPLDMTYCRLRSASPKHLERLRNMGVRASISVSLMVGGRLWGLVACHHSGARVLSPTQLHLCELLGEIVAAFIERMLNAAHLARIVAAQDTAVGIERDGRRAALISVLEAHGERLRGLFDAELLIARVGPETLLQGDCAVPLPPFEPLLARLEDGMFVSDALAQHLPLSDAQREACAGAALLSLSSDHSDYVLLGRPEWQRAVDWAGDPRKRGEPDGADGLSLMPRHSVVRWRQVVGGSSRPFDEADRKVLDIVRRTLVALRAGEREREAVAARQAAERKEAQLRIDLLHGARLSSMGELAASLAHELNQPLTAVANYVAACRQELRAVETMLPADVIELMDEAVDQAARAGEIVRRLRGFIEHGELERVSLNLSTTVAAAVRLALPTVACEGVAVALRLASDLPPLHADRVQVEQVVFNLVRNSLEAMANAPHRLLTVTTGHVGAAVEVTVSDTGPGLDDEIRAHLFEPFRSSKRSGMGIGLSLCRSIVEAHGGRITARDGGPGATFVFTLPVV